MKFIIQRKTLLNSLTKAGKAIDTKARMPILGHVLLTASKAGLKVEATDLGLSFTQSLGAEVSVEGSIALPFKELLAALKTSTAQELLFGAEFKRWTTQEVTSYSQGSKVDIEHSSAEAVLLLGSAHRTMAGVVSDDFPKLPDTAGLEWFLLKTKTFFEMIDKVYFSCSTDETRFHLNGALLMSSPRGFSLASTDGHRLSVVERPSLTELDLSKGAIIPRKGLWIIQPIFGKSSTVEIALSGSNLYFRDSETTLAVKCIDAEFPDYKQVIPEQKTLTHKAILWRSSLVDAFKAALSTFDRKMGLGVGLTLTNDKLTLTTPTMTQDLPCEYRGSEFSSAVNCKYALEWLGEAGSMEVKLEFPDHWTSPGHEPTPGPMKFLGLDDPDYMAVIMPIRL